MKNSTIIVIIVIIILLWVLFKYKKTNASASLPGSNIIDTVKSTFTSATNTNSTTATINYSNTEMEGSKWLDTNLKILVNGQEKAMLWGTESGTLTVNDGDIVDVSVFQGTPWAAAGSNYLIITEDKKELLNEDVPSITEGLSFEFKVKGGSLYNITNKAVANG